MALTEVSASEYTLDLSTVTTVEGSYELTLVAVDSGIESLDAVPLADDAMEAFVVDFPVPTAEIVEVSPDPSSTSIGEVMINFSEAVVGVDVADFELTLDGSVVDLLGLGVTEVSPSEYTLDLSTVTTVEGSYVLTLDCVRLGDRESERCSACRRYHGSVCDRLSGSNRSDFGGDSRPFVDLDR